MRMGSRITPHLFLIDVSLPESPILREEHEREKGDSEEVVDRDTTR